MVEADAPAEAAPAVDHLIEHAEDALAVGGDPRDDQVGEGVAGVVEREGDVGRAVPAEEIVDDVGGSPGGREAVGIDAGGQGRVQGVGEDRGGDGRAGHVAAAVHGVGDGDGAGAGADRAVADLAQAALIALVEDHAGAVMDHVGGGAVVGAPGAPDGPAVQLVGQAAGGPADVGVGFLRGALLGVGAVGESADERDLVAVVGAEAGEGDFDEPIGQVQGLVLDRIGRVGPFVEDRAGAPEELGFGDARRGPVGDPQALQQRHGVCADGHRVAVNVRGGGAPVVGPVLADEDGVGWAGGGRHVGEGGECRVGRRRRWGVAGGGWGVGSQMAGSGSRSIGSSHGHISCERVKSKE